MPQNRPHVLLVDDEAGVLLMLKTTLRRHGFDTTQASGGREALEHLEKGTRFDVIVSDIHMPNFDGLRFLRSVRESDLDVPVILMTGNPSIESSSSALEYGAFRYLLKPVMPAALKDVIEHAVRLHRVARLKREALELQGGEGKWLGDRAALEARFDRAMSGLWMAFQPIVTWRGRAVVAYEGLLRTTEPAIPHPGAFLDAAERLDRLKDLGRAIRARVAQTTLPEDGAKLFVNLHPRDLLDDELYDPDAPLSARAKGVVLEITERAALDGISDLAARIQALRYLGFEIAVDDLGAGYAGLSSFAVLDPNVAKLDMSLVRGIDVHPRKQAIVRSLRELCTELGVMIVAEGVETAAERDMLVSLGCDIFQGYLFAKPGPAFPRPSF
jgi:EAL domain-containing protein (putative c-di-GMP-specific phosphodiesterase class I)